MQMSPQAGNGYETSTPVWLGDGSCLCLLAEAPETEMTKDCRSFFPLLWSLWNMHHSLVSASSADNPFLSSSFTVSRTAVTLFLWVLCDVIILVFTETRTGTHICYLSLFPVPICRPFIPSGGSVISVTHLHLWRARRTHKTRIVLFGWHNITIRPGTLGSQKKHQHVQFVFVTRLRTDSQRSLSYKIEVPQKYCSNSFDKKKVRLN